jgi:hypothetical protein
VNPAELLDVSTRLRRFTKPVLLLWGGADRFFPISLAHRLQNAFPSARVVDIPYGRLFSRSMSRSGWPTKSRRISAPRTDRSADGYAVGGELGVVVARDLGGR